MVSGEQEIVNQLCKIHDEMKQIRMLSKAVEDRTIDVYFVTIPEEGGSREFAVGTTKIDFKTGVIVNPGGSTDELSRKLDLVQNKDDMHSISIHSNQNIKFRLNGSGQQSINADFLFQLPYVTYTVLEITCTEISAINIFACTNPQATLGNFKVTTISTIEQESISGDTDETQAWDVVVSLKNNMNRIRHQIIAITGEAWGTVSTSIATLVAQFDIATGHEHDGIDSKKVDASNVVNTPTGNIVADDIQAAIDELDTEKASKNPPIVIKTFAESPYTATLNDEAILCDATDGNIVINLPTAVGKSGQMYNIKKTDASAHTVTIDANDTETIDEALTIVITGQNDSISPKSDDANWWVM
ncbi:hypothetical protein KA005_65205 [bacterium]|nr:hypothetical protein [bacterium]